MLFADVAEISHKYFFFYMQVVLHVIAKKNILFKTFVYYYIWNQYINKIPIMLIYIYIYYHII